MGLGPFRYLRSLLLLCFDLVSIAGIFIGIYFARLRQFPDYLSLDLWLIIATFIVTLFISGTYVKGQNLKLPRFPIRTFFVSLVAGIICIFWVYLLGPQEFNNYFGRGILPVATVLVGIVTTLNRYALNRIYHYQEKGIELLYMGYSRSGEAFLKELNSHSEIRSISVLCDSTQETIHFSNTKFLNKSDSVSILRQNWHGIIIDPEHHSSADETNNLVSLRLSGTPILTLSEYYERHWYMVPIDHIKKDWFLQSQGFSMLANPISLRLKRIIDIIMSFLLISVSLPILLLSALLIKLTSKGPVLFQQERVGYRNDIFTIYKLRTMIADAEADGAQWAKNDDPRITKVGNFLRKSRIDELPQCWNVLKGDMSFVGPRPERPEFTQELAENIPFYELRHMVKPGITGWAQVIFPYGASAEDAMKKLQYELYYIKNQSLILDLNIILRTLITVFQRTGR